MTVDSGSPGIREIRTPGAGVSPWILAVLPAVLLAVWHLTEGPDLLSDDYAQYLLHAEALVKGRAYTDIPYIYTAYNPFVGPEAEPPGLPLTLWLVLESLGRDLLAIKLLMLAFMVGVAILGGRYFRADSGMMGSGVAFLVAFSLQLLHAPTEMGSDLGFCAFLWGVIILSESQERWSAGRVVAICLLGMGALLYRLAAAPLIPAMVLFALLRFRQQWFRPVVPIVFWSLVFVLMNLWLPTSVAVAGEITAGSKGILTRALTVLEYRYAVFDSHLYPFRESALNGAYHLISSGIMIVGLVAWLRRSTVGFLHLFSLCYVGLLAVVPVTVERYLWPLYPLFAFGLLTGLRTLVCTAFPGWPARRAAAVTGGLVASVACLAAWVDAEKPRPASLASQAQAQELFAHLRDVASRHSPRVVFFKPRTLAWETGVAAMGPFTSSPDVMLDEFRAKRITHVVLGDMGSGTTHERSLERLVEARRAVFVQEFRNNSFTVYRLLGNPDPAVEGARFSGGEGG